MMKKEAEVFDQIVNWRRSCRKFDQQYDFPTDVVERSLRRAVLAPNSSNMQLWEFYRVRTPEKIQEVAGICLNQQGAQTASEIVVFVARPDLWKKRIHSHLNRIQDDPGKNQKKRLFSTSQMDYYKKIMPLFYNRSFGWVKDIYKWFIVNKRRRNKAFMTDVYSRHVSVVVHKSTALAAQTFMLSISAEGYDSLPMEGLDAKRMKKFLKLPRKAEINMVVAVGKRLEEGIRGERFRVPFEEVCFEA
jgi:nitroreductase